MPMQLIGCFFDLPSLLYTQISTAMRYLPLSFVDRPLLLDHFSRLASRWT
ncbi:hypothetical protein V6Z11_D08G216500 [Gossypium hirsutum]